MAGSVLVPVPATLTRMSDDTDYYASPADEPAPSAEPAQAARLTSPPPGVEPPVGVGERPPYTWGDDCWTAHTRQHHSAVRQAFERAAAEIAELTGMPCVTYADRPPARGPYIIRVTHCPYYLHFHRLRDEMYDLLCEARQMMLSAGWDVIPTVSGGKRPTTSWAIDVATGRPDRIAAATEATNMTLLRHGIAARVDTTGEEATVTLTLSELHGIAGSLRSPAGVL